MVNFALKKCHMANGFPRATQSKKLHEIQDLLQELPPKDLNEMAAAWRSI